MDIEGDRLLTTAQVAEILSIKPSTVNQDRVTNRLGIPFVKIGKKTVRYKASALNQFIESLQTRKSTSQADLC